MLKIKPFYFKIAFGVAILLLISYLAMIFTGENGWYDLNNMKQELKNIKAKNEQIKQENVYIYQKIDRIKTDPVFQENIARQELKMIGKDEKVFKFDDADPSKNNTTPPKSEPISPVNNEDLQKNNPGAINSDAAPQKSDEDLQQHAAQPSNTISEPPKSESDTAKAPADIVKSNTDTLNKD